MKITLIVLLALLVGCSQLHQGTVIDKRYSPMYSAMTTQTIFVGKTVTTIPVSQIVPEEWEIKVEGQVSDGGKTIREWWSVDRYEFESIKVGQHITRSE